MLLKAFWSILLWNTKQIATNDHETPFCQFSSPSLDRGYQNADERKPANKQVFGLSFF